MTKGLAPTTVQEQASQVVRVTDAYLDPLAEIIRQAWDPRATAAGIRKARAAAAAVNPHGEGIDVPTFLFLTSGRPLGHLTTIPVNISVEDSQHAAHWFKGFWVVPEHRNGPVGFLLLREALRHLATTLSMVVQPAPRRLFHSLGLRDFGRIPNYVRVLRPARVLRRLDFSATGLAPGPSWAGGILRVASAPGLAHVLGLAASVALKGWTLSQPRSRGVAVTRPEALDPEEADRLWTRVQRRLVAAPHRDFSHIRARYISKGETYIGLSVRQGRELAGFALVRRPRESADSRLRGIRMATLSDLVYPLDQPEIGLRLLAAAERAVRDLGADALFCSGSHSTLPPLLRRRAYVRLGGNVHFMARPDGFSMESVDLEDWWLTRADGEADDAL